MDFCRKHFCPSIRVVVALAALLQTAGVGAADIVSGVSTQAWLNAASSIKAAELLFAASVPDHQQRFSFEQLVKLAITDHPAILSRRASLESAESDVAAAEGERFPTPTFSVDKGLKENFASPASNVDKNKNSDRTVSLRQPLWTGGRITYGIAGAQSRYEASKESVHETEQAVFIALVNAYSEALRWQTRKAVSAESLLQHQRLYEMIKRRVQAEASPSVDLDLAQGRLYQAEVDLSYADQALKSATLQLTMLAGQPLGAFAPLGSSLFAQIESQEASVAKAQDCSPLLSRLGHESDAAQAEVGVRKSAYWPQLAVRYDKQAGPFTSNFDRLLVTADMQIGAGLSIVHGVNAAQSRVEAAKLGIESAARDVAQQVSSDWNDYTAGLDRLDNAYKASLISDAVFDSYTRQYTAGRKSWLDVMNALREVSQSKGTVIDAYSQMMSSGMKLMVLTGKLNASNQGQTR